MFKSFYVSQYLVRRIVASQNACWGRNTSVMKQTDCLRTVASQVSFYYLFWDQTWCKSMVNLRDFTEKLVHCLGPGVIFHDPCIIAAISNWIIFSTIFFRSWNFGLVGYEDSRGVGPTSGSDEFVDGISDGFVMQAFHNWVVATQICFTFTPKIGADSQFD